MVEIYLKKLILLVVLSISKPLNSNKNYLEKKCKLEDQKITRDEGQMLREGIIPLVTWKGISQTSTSLFKMISSGSVSTIEKKGQPDFQSLEKE